MYSLHGTLRGTFTLPGTLILIYRHHPTSHAYVYISATTSFNELAKNFSARLSATAGAAPAR